MKIIEQRALRGANYYSRLPVIFMKVDLGELEQRPSDDVPNMLENLKTMLPSLEAHTCSPGVRGGFFQRITRGTWAGHVAEHIAIELQVLIGHNITFGKTFTLEEKGTYDIVYRYINEQVGLRAGEIAAEVTTRLYNGEATEMAPYIEELKELAEETEFGPSTQSIVDAAKKRGIPYIRLNEHSYVQFGQGKYQRKIEATLMDDTSALGVEIAADKERTKRILEQGGIPVPKGESVSSKEEALKVADRIGYPVVLKPLSGNHGRGVMINLKDAEELGNAVDSIQGMSKRMIVENYLQGHDFRMLVIDEKLVAVARREPPTIIGDGESTVQQLIDALNKDKDRGEGHEKRLSLVHVDSETTKKLKEQGHTLESIPAKGETVVLKSTANISTGGIATDVTDTVHPFNQRMAERMARLIGLNVMGIDVMAETLEQPLEQGKSGVVEVNAGPGFRMHLAPSYGTPRPVGEAVIDMLFPEGTKYTVPTVAVTGTNGKTTTTRLISHILMVAGRQVGMTSTDAVTVDNNPILIGDYSGPDGAKSVMRDNHVEYAVLEVARGGILRRGLGFQRCDVGVLLNVTSDHLGFNGIDTLDQLARVKSTVLDAVDKEGFGVLNADDPRVLEKLDKLRGIPMLFSKDENHPALQKNLEGGHCNVTINDDKIVIQKPAGTVEVAKIIEIPITFEGRAVFNVENVLAAVAATYALGIPEDKIEAGVLSFSPSIGQSPGRMNIIDVGDFKVLIDYGHNIGAIHATGEFIQKLMPGRKIRMASGVGNRRFEDMEDFGEAMAKYYDHIVLADSSPRIRKLGETADHVKTGLMRGGMSEDQITLCYKEAEATQLALNMAEPGDLVILQVENIAKVTEDVLEYKQKYIEEHFE